MEIELIVLAEFKKKFVRLARSLGFNIGSDFSIEKRSEGFERLYRQCEIDIGKRPWTQIERSVTALASWLRHEVPVKINGRDYILPVGKVPQTMQAGLHVHFDLGDWFDSPEHFTNFLKNVNRFLSQDMTKMVAGSRYASPNSSGRQYASAGPIPVPNRKDIERFKKSSGGKLSTMWAKKGFSVITIDPKKVRHFVNWWSDESSLTRDRAINLVSSWDHGTLEFRFMNSTLNVSSISGWIEFMAELIDMSRESDYGQFSQAIRQGERQHIGQFMDRRKQAHGSKARHFPWDKYSYEVPRTYRRAGLD